MPKKLQMTRWYDPALLVQTGIRVAISTVFGQFADRREAMAAANAIEPQPFSSSFIYEDRRGEGFWLDYLADTGDGWDPTYAMAQLLTQPQVELPCEKRALPRGRVQILGGDQVYPTASKEAYENRFLYPFDEAFERLDESARAEMPDLYALPGNHDWYDGLAAFFGLFCRRRIAVRGSIGIDRPGRLVAGRKTNQTRSYFAIKLPHNWWLWGTDSQLEGYIDQPQIEYFQYVASHWMEPGSKVILCVGQPSWAYVDTNYPKRAFGTFSYLERLAGLARMPPGRKDRTEGWPEESEPMGHRLKLVLTGDSHHYSRYREGDRHYVTCGGGGAFLHPTHQLDDKEFTWDYPPPGEPAPGGKGEYPRRFSIADREFTGIAQEPALEKAIYPDAATSRSLTRRNIGFAMNNMGMTAVFTVAYLLYNWMLHANARIEGFDSLVAALSVGGWPTALRRYFSLSFTSPWPVVMFAAAMAGYYYFADSPHDKWQRFKIGVMKHGLLQAVAAVAITVSVIWGLGLLRLHDPGVFGPGFVPIIEASIVLAASLAAAYASATLFGLYLWHELNARGRHWNEAFSSLAVADYKCFLRMNIKADGSLNLYAVGLDHVPQDGGSPATLRPHLVEGPVAIS